MWHDDRKIRVDTALSCDDEIKFEFYLTKCTQIHLHLSRRKIDSRPLFRQTQQECQTMTIKIGNLQTLSSTRTFSIPKASHSTLQIQRSFRRPKPLPMYQKHQIWAVFRQRGKYQEAKSEELRHAWYGRRAIHRLIWSARYSCLRIQITAKIHALQTLIFSILYIRVVAHNAQQW